MPSDKIGVDGIYVHIFDFMYYWYICGFAYISTVCISRAYIQVEHKDTPRCHLWKIDRQKGFPFLFAGFLSQFNPVVWKQETSLIWQRQSYKEKQQRYFMPPEFTFNPYLVGIPPIFKTCLLYHMELSASWHEMHTHSLMINFIGIPGKYFPLGSVFGTWWFLDEAHLFLVSRQRHLL